MQSFNLDSRDADNAKLLDELGISQLGNNSIPELSNSDQLFHESLVQSIQELLASEAALEAEAAAAAAASASRLSAGNLPGPSHVQAAPAYRLDGLPLSAEALAPQQQQLPSASTGSLASGLPLETLELLAASHLQLLVQQQALMAQQPARNSVPSNLSNMLLNAQPAGHTNDGSLMFVTPQHSPLVGMQPGWVGHRVVALPGDHTKQVTHLDLSTLSASSQQSTFSHPHLSVRSEDIIRQTQLGSRTNMPPAASWDHLSASSVPSLQTMLQPSSSSRTSTTSNARELPSIVDLGDFPTIARRGRGRAYGPKSLRQRMPAALPDFAGLRPGAPLRTAAPSWAGADWDPLRDVQNRPKTGGTGVFLPPGTGVFLPVSEEAGSSKTDSPRVGDSQSGVAAAGSGAGGVKAFSGNSSISKSVEVDSFDDLPASLLP